MIEAVPKIRVTDANRQPIRDGGDYVLYWMVAQRRVVWNFGLQHAVRRAQELGVPLVLLEALRADYPWASTRLHSFVMDGMADNARACEQAGVRYLAYVEGAAGAGKGLLRTLAKRARLVVTDEFPCFFVPKMVAAAGAALDVRLEQVDGNGLLPLRAGGKAHSTAYAFRRLLQRDLARHLDAFPRPRPLAGARGLGRAVVSRDVLRRWAPCPDGVLTGDHRAFLADLPIDQGIAPTSVRGGSRSAEAEMRRFLDHKLADYADRRNQPEADATSGLSPYLHFGHVSPHQVVAELARRENWNPAALASTCSGQRQGWWGMSPSAEECLDQLITWRELGYGFCFYRPDDYDRFEALPDWARATLEAHAGDPREYVYELETLAAGRTHDPLWSAAQLELVQHGRIHNYLRMLWGKKILEWTAHPREALAVLIELNNRYALDGRNPNSYSGIFWVLGRFDRAWGPERPIFGKVRYMSSENTARKVRVKQYVATHAQGGLF